MPPPGMLLLGVGYFLMAGFAINLGYHRVLSHRSLKLAPWFERIIVTLGLPAGTPIQWAGNHRQHHAHTDQAGDPHSPHLDGFWYSHTGWYLQTHAVLPCVLYSLAGPLRTLFDGWHRPRTNQQYNHLAPDVAEDPWYRLISRPLPYLLFAVAHVALFFGGAAWLWGAKGVALLWVELTIVYNLGDAIDSVAHLVGEQPYASPHRARNHWFMGFATLGEGWHANHHQFPGSARHGLFPGQFDWTWQIIRLLQALGLAWDVRVVEPERVEARLLRTGAVDANAEG